MSSKERYLLKEYVVLFGQQLQPFRIIPSLPDAGVVFSVAHHFQVFTLFERQVGKNKFVFICKLGVLVDCLL